MNILITPKEQICKELTDIDSFLNITMSENAEEAVLRGNDLAVYVARSGKLLADAKYWLNEAMNSETMKTLAETAKNAKATATAINALVNSLCREERYLVDWCERCNRTATHQLSWCVTVISKAKEEMKMAGMYNNNNRQNDKRPRSTQILALAFIAIILMGLDENITGFPFIMGAAIIIYLFINMLILTSRMSLKREQWKLQN